MNSQEFAHLCEACNKLKISDKNSKAAIILAGGKGTRMGNPNKHKCTFELNGEPAIYPLLRTLRDFEINTNVLVVGALSEQIMEVVSRKYPDTIFAYQPLQKGTGNAGKHGTYPLQKVGFHGDIFILAGDSHVEKHALEKLYSQFKEQDADMALLTKGVKDVPKAGRIIKNDSGQVVGSVEFWDTHKAIAIQKMQHYLSQLSLESTLEEKIPSKEVRKDVIDQINAILINTLESPRKITSIFPQLIKMLSACEKKPQESEEIFKELVTHIHNLSGSIIITAKEYDPQNIEDTTQEVNISVYLFKSSVLYANIDKILSENAQSEEYLTDIVQILSKQNKKIISVMVESPNDVMSFNDPEELQQINDYLKEKKKKDDEDKLLHSQNLKSVQDWLTIFQNQDAQLLSNLEEIYGTDKDFITSKIAEFKDVLQGYGNKFSLQDDVFIVRSPGRINLMGRHIDHRGGNVNMMAINREMIFIVSPRDDDLIIAYNRDNTQFPAFSFSISENLTSVDWEDWMDFISNGTIIDMIRNSQGNWMNYLKAAALRLQVHTHTTMLKGAKIFAAGNIPQAAGLSSSSALVVATLDSLITINNINIHPREFIDLCGEGEWFVGTRGGSADHAAIKVSKNKTITQIGFFPFEIKGSVELPDDLDLVVINSKIKAEKSHTVLKHYNEKIIAYELGFELVKSNFPEYADKLLHLRDMTHENLGVDIGQLYSMIKSLPQQIQVSQLSEHINSDKLAKLHKKIPSFSLFEPTDFIPIRSVILYGVSECYRAKRFGEQLRSKNYIQSGKLMNISHNGDRVADYLKKNSPDQDNKLKSEFKLEDYEEYTTICSDEYMDTLISEKTPIEQVPGSYACSIKEIDFIVDTLLVLGNEGEVFGAQISGAGLGGCVMALISSKFTKSIIATLEKILTNKLGYAPEIFISKPILGSSLLQL